MCPPTLLYCSISTILHVCTSFLLYGKVGFCFVFWFAQRSLAWYNPLLLYGTIFSVSRCKNFFDICTTPTLCFVLLLCVFVILLIQFYLWFYCTIVVWLNEVFSFLFLFLIARFHDWTLLTEFHFILLPTLPPSLPLPLSFFDKPITSAQRPKYFFLQNPLAGRREGGGNEKGGKETKKISQSSTSLAPANYWFSFFHFCPLTVLEIDTKMETKELQIYPTKHKSRHWYFLCFYAEYIVLVFHRFVSSNKYKNKYNISHLTELRRSFKVLQRSIV